jgi:hypothetical protein
MDQPEADGAFPDDSRHVVSRWSNVVYSSEGAPFAAAPMP